MNNLQAIERLEQTGCSIKKLFWRAAIFDDYDFNEFLNELSYQDWKKIVPQLEEEEFNEYESYNESGQILCDFNKFGFIAEIHTPECYDFSYDENGKATSWSVNGGICRLNIVYAESTNELIEEIEKLGSELMKEFIQKDKKNKESNAIPSNKNN